MLAAQAWVRLRQGETVSKDEVLAAYSLIPTGNGLDRGAKTMLENAEIEGGLDLDDLQINFGLSDVKGWKDQLTRLTKDEVQYLTLVEQNEHLDHKPRIRISTIHGAKGLEADNVVLLTDLSRASANAWSRGKEEEIRVLYVALTRARKRLFVVNPRTYIGYGI